MKNRNDKRRYLINGIAKILDIGNTYGRPVSVGISSYTDKKNMSIDVRNIANDFNRSLKTIEVNER